MRKFNPDKKYLLHTATSILLVMVVAFLIFYLLYHVFLGFRTKPKTEAAVYGEAYDTLTLEGCVFRDETVLYSSYSGSVLYCAEENEKLSTNSTVADIYPASVPASTLNEIYALERRIELLTEALSRAHLLNDTSVIEAMTYDSLLEFSHYAQQSDLHSAIRSSDDLLVNLSRKQMRIDSQRDFSKLIDSLNTQKSLLLSSLGTPASSVRATGDGYFSKTHDGGEEIFDFGRVMSISVSDFERMQKDFERADQSNAALGKLVHSNEWYFVCATDHKTTDKFKTGEVYDIKFTENMNTVVPATLERIVTENETDKALLVFSCIDVPPSFEFLRTQKAQISVSLVKGLRIPRSSVRLIDGHTFVYILVGEKVYLRAVDILASSGAYYYVDDDTQELSLGENTYYGIRKNDSVIVYGTDLENEKIYK